MTKLFSHIDSLHMCADKIWCTETCFLWTFLFTPQEGQHRPDSALFPSDPEPSVVDIQHSHVCTNTSLHSLTFPLKPQLLPRLRLDAPSFCSSSWQLESQILQMDFIGWSSCSANLKRVSTNFSFDSGDLCCDNTWSRWQLNCFFYSFNEKTLPVPDFF